MTGEERLQRVLGQLKGVTPGRKLTTRTARCPVPWHGKRAGDKNQSLSVELTPTGIVQLHCYAGCSEDEILVAIGLTHGDLRPEVTPRGKRQPLRRHGYRDSTGTVIAVKVRWPPGRGKKYSWEQPDGTPGLGSIDPGLYNRPLINSALLAGMTIHICEGEHDADSLIALGMVATSSPHGVALPWPRSRVDVLRGAHQLVIIADNDKPGRTYARGLARQLADAGRTVSMLVPPAGYKDVTDMIESDDGAFLEPLPLVDDLDLGKLVVRPTSTGTAWFTQIPIPWVRQLDCDACYRLVGLLDSEHGTVAGQRKTARTLGWSQDKLIEHRDHLVERGIVEVEKHGYGKESYTLLNPSRDPTLFDRFFQRPNDARSAPLIRGPISSPKPPLIRGGDHLGSSSDPWADQCPIYKTYGIEVLPSLDSEPEETARALLGASIDTTIQPRSQGDASP